MRKTIMVATAAMAVFGAGAAAKAYKIDGRQPQGELPPAGSVPLPIDAYPDELDLEIWQSAI
jgi:hypothetical protein